MADYVTRVWECVADEPDIKGWITNYGARLATEETDGGRELRRTSLGAARLRDWDLVIMADHMPLQFARSIPKLIVPHGPGPSRLVRGGSYYYDRTRCLWPDGERVYASMLDTNHQAAARALEWVPEYKGRIRVVGDLRADELLSHRSSRDLIRERLGVGNRRLVAFMSTWGPHGLIPRYGRELLGECRRLATEGGYAFTLTMHQNLWDTRRAGTREWVDLVQSFQSEHIHVIGPQDDYAPFLAASDCAVTDHTSLAMIYSVLDLPMIPVGVPTDVLASGTFSRWLVDHRRPVTSAAHLRTALEESDSAFRLEGAPVTVDHLGEAATQTRLAVLDALHR